MRISDWSSYGCSSDLKRGSAASPTDCTQRSAASWRSKPDGDERTIGRRRPAARARRTPHADVGDQRHPARRRDAGTAHHLHGHRPPRSEEHTSELQSLMRISYAVFCLKKTKPYHSTHLYHLPY